MFNFEDFLACFLSGSNAGSLEKPSDQAMQQVPILELVDALSAFIVKNKNSEIANSIANTFILSFARARWDEYCSHQIRAQLHGCQETAALEAPLDKISVVTACMNRNTHLAKALPTWIKISRFTEIIVVDYGSAEPVVKTLEELGLANLKTIRVLHVNASHWCLAEAFNHGLYEAKNPYILKLDADTLIQSQADSSLRLSSEQFKTGNWRTFRNNYLNGILLAPADAILKVGGYNEQIRRYGWDDCDLYERLAELPLVKSDLVEDEFESIEHSDHKRVDSCDEMSKLVDINRLIQGNRISSNLLPKWTVRTRGEFAFKGSNKNIKSLLDVIYRKSYAISRIQENFLYSTGKEYSYSDMLHDLASELVKTPEPGDHLNNLEIPPLILLTSLYESTETARTEEMISCLRENCRIFSQIIILYEKPNQSQSCSYAITNEIKRLHQTSLYDGQSAPIEVIGIGERPSFADFFKIINSHKLVHGPAIFVISNGDIYFDSSIRRVHELNITEKTIAVLSRWDRIPDNHQIEEYEVFLDAHNQKWALVDANSNSCPVPNYLSADAWICASAPTEWKEYTYQLGTYFCDSFFINRAFRSGISVINPCLSIRCYHRHNQLINSSSAKFQDKKSIVSLYEDEKRRLRGDDPVAGAQWITIEQSKSKFFSPQPYRWNPIGSTWIKLGYVVNSSSINLFIDAIIEATDARQEDVFVTIVYDKRFAQQFKEVMEFVQYLNTTRLHVDVRRGTYESVASRCEQEAELVHRLESFENMPWSHVALSLFEFIKEHSSPVLSDATYSMLSELIHIKGSRMAEYLRVRNSRQRLSSQAAQSCSYGKRQAERSKLAHIYLIIKRLSSSLYNPWVK